MWHCGSYVAALNYKHIPVDFRIKKYYRRKRKLIAVVAHLPELQFPCNTVLTNTMEGTWKITLEYAFLRNCSNFRYNKIS